MLYSSYITKLRNQVGDTKRKVHVDWIGDGTTTVFQMPSGTFPVLDDESYVVKVNGTLKAETTDYTIDKDAGTLTMNTPPTDTHTVTIDSSAVHLKDEDWLNIINDTIYSLGDDFWKEFVDTTVTATAGALSVSLTSARPKCIALYEFQARQTSTDDYKTVETYTNWRYDRENNAVYVGGNQVFNTIGSQLRIRGLEGYEIGDDVTDTIDVQDRFLTVIEYGSIARYWKWRYKSVVELVSKMTQESTRTPLQELMMLADRFSRDYETEKAKLKPQKPPRVIPSYKQGGGRP